MNGVTTTSRNNPRLGLWVPAPVRNCAQGGDDIVIHGANVAPNHSYTNALSSRSIAGNWSFSAQ